jgi:GNAT superfamily N-acetyltransferase
MELVRPDGFLVTDDRSKIDIARVHRWLSEESYWATGSSLDVVTRSIQGSISLGCFAPDGEQVGITRLITDGAVFALISDVFVDSNFRGRGLGKFLVETAVGHPEVKDVRRMLLATSDAHELYGRFGFTALSSPGRWMEKRAISTPESSERASSSSTKPA